MRKNDPDWPAILVVTIATLVILALSLLGCKRTAPPEVATMGTQRRVDRQSPSLHVYTNKSGKVPEKMSITKQIDAFVMKHSINPKLNVMGKEWKMAQTTIDEIGHAYAEENMTGHRFSVASTHIFSLYGVVVKADETMRHGLIRLWYTDGTYKEMQLES